MPTYVLRIGDLPAGATEYPVTLFDAAAPGDILAAAQIHGDLRLGPGVAQFGREEIVARLRDEASEDDAFAPMGRQLYAALTGQTIKAALARLLLPGDRVMLDVRPPLLRRVPWELMMDGRFAVFLDRMNPWSRGSLERPVTLEPPDLPLRVLVIVGCRRTETKIDAEEEVVALVEALRPVEPQVDLWVERRPSRDRIKQLFAPGALQPHVVHFIGHGSVQGDQGVLELCVRDANDETSTATDWDAETIANDFRNLPRPRLVLLNACRTGEPGEGALPFSVADGFLLAGVPAVISMGGEVTGRHAIAFSRAFYATLATEPGELSLDVAVACAREAVSNLSTPPLKYRDWALPVLELRSPPDAIVRVPPPLADLRNEVSGAPFFKDRPCYVDRREDRSRFWTSLSAAGASSRVLWLTGKPYSGKTGLALLLVERCCVGGYETRYVSFGARDRLTALDLLNGIVGGQRFGGEFTRLTSPLPGAAFDALRRHIADLSAQRQPARETRLAALGCYERFRDALLGLCATRPVMIVVDQLGALSDAQFRQVVGPGLVGWHATGLQNPIRLLFVVNTDQQLDWGISPDDRMDTPDFGYPEWPALAREYVRRAVAVKYHPPNPVQADYIEGHIRLAEPMVKAQGRWGPATFSRIAKWVDDAFAETF